MKRKAEMRYLFVPLRVKRPTHKWFAEHPFDALMRNSIGCRLLWIELADRPYVVCNIDARRLLRAFARWCALEVADIWAAPADVVKFLRDGVGPTKDLDAVLRDAAARASRRLIEGPNSGAAAYYGAVDAAIWALHAADYTLSEEQLRETLRQTVRVSRATAITAGRKPAHRERFAEMVDTALAAARESHKRRFLF